MKLYHNGEPEGWQIPGQQDRKAERVDVPSSPAELAAWLNARDVSPRLIDQCARIVDEEFDNAPSVEELLEAAERATAESPKRPPAPAIARPPNCRELEEFVLDRATGAEIERIFATIGARFAELRKEARQ